MCACKPVVKFPLCSQAATLQAALADKEKALVQRENELQAIKTKERQVNGMLPLDYQGKLVAMCCAAIRLLLSCSRL